MLDEKNCMFIYENNKIKLTKKETRILAGIMNSQRKMLTYDQIIKAIYDREIEGDIKRAAQIICRLNSKLYGIIDIRGITNYGYILL